MKILTILASVAGILALIVACVQLSRTPKPQPKPKPQPEPFTPTCLTIIGIPMDRGHDLFGRR